MSESVKVITKEGTVVEIPRNIAELSSVIMEAINANPDDDVILSEADSESVNRALKFYAMYLDKPYPALPKPLRNHNLKDNGLSGEYEKYADFITEISFDDLYNLFVTSNYCSWKSLLDLCSAAVAAEFKKAEEKNGIQGIRDLLKIESGFTPEEEAMKREDYK